MIRIILSGSNGKMGQTITRLVSEDEDMVIVAGVSIDGQALNYYPVYKNIQECDIDADVVLDFSNVSTLQDTLTFIKNKKMPAVIATTGFSTEQIKEIEKTAQIVPILRSANMSLGINLMTELIRKATKVLCEDFDIEIVEAHHNQKVDAPSGTAILLADEINDELSNEYNYEYNRHDKKEKRPKKEIGIHAIRGGNIVGDHTVIFAGPDEIIEIKHKAQSRDLFARGAIKAVKFMANKREAGKLYTMKDVINEEEI